MKNRLFLLLTLAASVYYMASCRPSKVKIPSDIIPEKKFQSVMIDVLTAEAFAAQHNMPADTGKTITKRLYAAVFQKHQITKDEYYRSYDFYAKHPELFEKDMATVIDSLNALSARAPAPDPVKPAPAQQIHTYPLPPPRPIIGKPLQELKKK